MIFEAKTKLMHSIVWKELRRIQLTGNRVKSIKEEVPVLLEKNKQGSFDFVMELNNGKKIGFEILGRPSFHKLKHKLVYLPFIDKYVFVLPFNSFSFYRLPERKVFFKEFIPKSFPNILSNNKIFVWLVDLKNKKIIKKSHFKKVFRVKT